jgi:hypothetical protein
LKLTYAFLRYKRMCHCADWHSNLKATSSFQHYFLKKYASVGFNSIPNQSNSFVRKLSNSCAVPLLSGCMTHDIKGFFLSAHGITCTKENRCLCTIQYPRHK